MVNKIDMSLDEIIKSSKTLKRRGRGSGGGRWGGDFRGGRGGAGARRKPFSAIGGERGAILKGRNHGGGIQKAKFTRGDVNSAWKHDMYDGCKRGGLFKAAGDVAKLVVSNLDYGVSDADIQELFSEFGQLKKVAVHYDRNGRSLGTADVVFERRFSAIKAIKQYDGVPLDGRPMNIQLVTSDVSSLIRVERVDTGGIPVKRKQGGPPPRRGVPTGSRRGGAANRIFQGGLGRGRRSKEPAPTIEELDADLDAYLNNMKI